MNAFWTIYNRQLTAWFRTGIAHITATTFLLVAGLSFCRLAAQSMEERLLPGDLMFGSVFFWSMVLVSITMITMGIISDERKSGAIEMLLTAPVTDTQVVLAKYCAALTCFAGICAPTLLYAPLLNRLGTAPVLADPAALAGGYLILLLIGAFYTAFGVMVSALSRGPVIAAGLCITGLGLAFFTDIFQYLLPAGHATAVIEYISPVRHIMDFSQGILDSRPLALYGSGTVFCLFIAIKFLESRHWR